MQYAKITNVKKEAEFQEVFEARQSVANHRLVYRMDRKDQPHFRVGISVGKELVMLSIGIGSNAVFGNRSLS